MNGMYDFDADEMNSSMNMEDAIEIMDIHNNPEIGMLDSHDLMNLGFDEED